MTAYCWLDDGDMQWCNVHFKDD